MPPDLLDDALELDAGRVRRRVSHEFVEASLKTGESSIETASNRLLPKREGAAVSQNVRKG
jgi:hypothetical protein